MFACLGESYVCFNSGLVGQVAFKLYPVEPLNAFLRICIDEGMQFAIRHAVEHPAVRANVLRGVRHTDSYRAYSDERGALLDGRPP